MQGLYDVALTCQWMVASSRLSTWHSSFDGLEPCQHLILKLVELSIEDIRTYRVKLMAHSSQLAYVFEFEIVEDFLYDLLRQVQQENLLVRGRGFHCGILTGSRGPD